MAIRFEIGIYNGTYFPHIIWETRWKVIRPSVRKIPPLDSNLRQAVITFHGGFRDEWRHDRCTNILIFIHGVAIRHCSNVRGSHDMSVVVIRTSTSATYMCVCVFSFLAKDTAVRDRITELYYVQRYVSLYVRWKRQLSNHPWTRDESW